MESRRYNMRNKRLKSSTEIKCHDCYCKEGEIHEYGCDMESCPFCGQQLITCDCVYEKLNIDCSPGTWTYENGLTDEQEEQWIDLLNQTGRVPYIHYPSICGKCGALYPPFFFVPDEDWKKYIAPRHREQIICRKCYDRIRSLIDGAKK